MKLLVIDEKNGKVESYELEEDMDMPYTSNGVLTVGDFNTRGTNELAWTTKQFLEDYNRFASRFKKKIPVSRGFSRAWERVRDGFMHHQLGTALDIGESLGPTALRNIAQGAERSELFDYVSDTDLVPRIVHIHQSGKAAGDLLPFAAVEKGMVKADVAVLQDALQFLGYPIAEITGVFDQRLEDFVKNYQRRKNLQENGIADAPTWVSIYESMFNTVPLV